jgi:hypothetical protein
MKLEINPPPRGRNWWDAKFLPKGLKSTHITLFLANIY